MPRVDEIHGFVFGSFAPDGPTLREHLGAAADAFDRLVRLSPTGEIELTAGWLQHKVQANWKMLVENETDGYHPQFVHSSIFERRRQRHRRPVRREVDGGRRATSATGTPRTTCAPSSAASASRWAGSAPRPERVPDYVAQMEAAHGDAAEQILIDGSPHVMVFPNLFIAEIQLFVIQPLAVDQTVQHVTARAVPGLRRT